jgi:hypothetical protein
LLIVDWITDFKRIAGFASAVSIQKSTFHNLSFCIRNRIFRASGPERPQAQYATIAHTTGLILAAVTGPS